MNDLTITDNVRGKALSEIVRQGGSGGPQHSHREKPPPCGTHYEEVLMREQTICGGHKPSFCPQIMEER